MWLSEFRKIYRLEWIDGSCGHFPGTEGWYRSIDGARRGQANTVYVIIPMSNGQQFEMWFSLRSHEAFVAMYNKNMQAEKEAEQQASTLSQLMTGLVLGNK